MKFFTILLTGTFLLLINNTSKCQVTNLLVNGSSSNFTMTSGSNISWSYDIPTGATTLVEIWYDVNGNGSIDAGDVLYQSFNQTDGDTVGQNGPPDMDGQVNGKISFTQPVGIAPGKYVLRFTEGGQSVSIAGTNNALSSPTYTISGTITPPTGKSAANIFVEVHRSEKLQPNFWDAVTNANGNYTIQMNSDTAGNPWEVRLVSNPFPPNIVSPDAQKITINGNKTGINFSFLTAAAQIAGTVKDENGNPIPNTDVNVFGGNQTTQVNRNAKTNASGVYQLGLTQTDLAINGGWSLEVYLESNSGITTDLLDGVAFVNSISQNDSVARNIVIYKANSTITGKVTIDGAAPGFPIHLTAVNRDSASSSVMSDGSTGNFSFPVTNKIYSYQINYMNTSQVYYMNTVVAHPGDTNVLVNLSTTPTAVKQTGSNLPKQFSLKQNYPDPFNPSTIIKYELPVNGFVNLSVYNILGEKVAQLVNKDQRAGSYKVEFNANNLSSGIYLYKLTVGNYTDVKKMILMK